MGKKRKGDRSLNTWSDTIRKARKRANKDMEVEGTVPDVIEGEEDYTRERETILRVMLFMRDCITEGIRSEFGEDALDD